MSPVLGSDGVVVAGGTSVGETGTAGATSVLGPSLARLAARSSLRAWRSSSQEVMKSWKISAGKVPPATGPPACSYSIGWTVSA